MSNVRRPDSKKRHYIRLFSNPETMQKAIFMLNNGYSLSNVALVLGCDHSSVISFRERMIKKGVKFKIFGKGKEKKIIDDNIFEGDLFKKISIDNVIKGKKIERKIIKYSKFGEKINRGKDYKDYLREYLAKSKIDRIKSMDRAKKVIEIVHKKREKLGIVPEESTFNL